MSNVLMMLGPHMFTITALSFQKLSEEFSAEWAVMPHFGASPGLQFTGFGEDTKTISGVLFPQEFDNRIYIDAVTATIRAAIAVPFISWASGLAMAATIHGRVVIKSIKKDHDYINRYGQPGRITYSIDIQPFIDGGKPLGQWQ
ncbi:phage tail protein [Candidatus Tokpelaia sp.]|uniref:phage tail protein n=1 Tax=Candidatus Tokpelaia sp. TaxID=2233777 RepID=UPI00123A48C7|nr:phage tail protein [Candidatus Tokpelaia sp.]KAA6405678.1 phage tail protein [Candidatus Tokpelaia sp.]